jgi:hypothetical protein
MIGFLGMAAVGSSANDSACDAGFCLPLRRLQLQKPNRRSGAQEVLFHEFLLTSWRPDLL